MPHAASWHEVKCPRSLYENFSVLSRAFKNGCSRSGTTGGDPYTEGMGYYNSAAGAPLDRISAEDLQTYW